MALQQNNHHVLLRRLQASLSGLNCARATVGGFICKWLEHGGHQELPLGS